MHIACIQDPDDVQLYVQTETHTKGGIQLPTYRCARGSTSLESFHLHLNRFIPGTSASDLRFQAYLLEGLSRWNADRTAGAVSGVMTGPETYSVVLAMAGNQPERTSVCHDSGISGMDQRERPSPKYCCNILETVINFV
ncbi:Hypothetical predicted protein [Paramuricea clavata]|uniref:Uncharacterized protein n=1 Tax=Paramuricea clavata TaxID=317549 RepID=A0A7D9DG50_PARCT|nr:Hypothetical predicted protein [Paramuricea clavata]